MAQFRLQFPVGQVRKYADRYAYADDVDVIEIGRKARERGHYARAEFVTVCRWKTTRSATLVADNTASSVKRATHLALDEGSSERERMQALRSLNGVAWPTASVLLHLAYPERHPILDQRALQALGLPRPPTYSFRFWQEYVTAWLALVERAGVDGRMFDQALWQWSKEQGTRLY